MFIFYFLGVGLPCRSIFCQFWLCEEAQCVYLSLHLGSQVFRFLLSKPQNSLLFLNYIDFSHYENILGLQGMFLVKFLHHEQHSRQE